MRDGGRADDTVLPVDDDDLLRSAPRPLVLLLEAASAPMSLRLEADPKFVLAIPFHR